MKDKRITIEEIRKECRFNTVQGVYAMFKRRRERGDPPPEPEIGQLKTPLYNRQTMLKWLKKRRLKTEDNLNLYST